MSMNLILTSWFSTYFKWTLVSFFIYKQTQKQVSKTTLKGIKNLNESYKYEKTQIERIVNKDTGVIYEMLEDLYYSMFCLVLFFTIYLVLKTFNAGGITMGAYVGASIRYFFNSFRMLFFNMRLFEKARDSKKNIEKLNRRILILENRINSQLTDSKGL